MRRDLNNWGVYTLIDMKFDTCFGFTEPEVRGLFEGAGLFFWRHRFTWGRVAPVPPTCD